MPSFNGDRGFLSKPIPLRNSKLIAGPSLLWGYVKRLLCPHSEFRTLIKPMTFHCQIWDLGYLWKQGIWPPPESGFPSICIPSYLEIGVIHDFLNLRIPCNLFGISSDARRVSVSSYHVLVTWSGLIFGKDFPEPSLTMGHISQPGCVLPQSKDSGFFFPNSMSP